MYCFSGLGYHATTYLFRAIIFMATSNLQFSTAVLGLFIVNDTFFIVFYLVAKVSVYMC